MTTPNPREKFAEIAGRDMRAVQRKTDQIPPTPGGGDVFRIRDSDGAVAFEVDTDGKVTIPDLVSGDAAVPVDTLHVFIAAGQSNMWGAGQPVEGPLSPRVMQFGTYRRVLEQAPLQLDMAGPPSPATGTSPATFFAESYLATQPSRVGVLIVPTAASGTGFRGSPESPVAPATYTWTKGAANPTSAPGYGLYERSVGTTQAAITAAKNAGYTTILQGVLWLQGEHNAYDDPDRDPWGYDVKLDALIQNYRTDLGAPRLPFMLGRMVPEGIDADPMRQIVDAHHVATPARMPFTGVADSPRGAHNTGDTTHFSTLGNRILGDSFLRAWHQALGNTHI